MGKQRRTGVCAYCGQIRPLTRDHVVPKCLFIRPLPLDMITVPACEECNGDKSRHDDFLRDMLVIDIASEGNPIARKVFESKSIRAYQKDKSLVARIALNNPVEMPYFDDHGSLDVALVSGFDPERSDEMFGFLARGLYYHALKRPLERTSTISTRRLFKEDVDKTIDALNEVGAIGPITIGQNVFSCVFNYSHETPDFSFWFIEFYDSIQYSIVTRPGR